MVLGDPWNLLYHVFHSTVDCALSNHEPKETLPEVVSCQVYGHSDKKATYIV